MTTPLSELCPSCFAPLSAVRGPCGTCGFHGAEPQPRKDGEITLGALLRERYAIGRVLGRGGFGITYLAWDTRLRRRRAIKEYFPRGVVTRDATHASVSVVSGQTQLYAVGMEKYLEEARLLAQFEDHPCIVSPLDFFEENETAYLVMEYLEGETLRAYVSRSGGRISYEAALHVLSPVIEALATVHRAGILHRDVSPDNIFLTVKGEAKLLDFGAARQRLVDSSGSMTVILREHYAPPEQYTKSGRQGSWTDVYAFAATFYMAVTGRSPPPAPERLMQDRIEWPSRLGVSMPALAEQALMGALAVRIEERPQHIEELVLSLAGKRLGPSGSLQDPIHSLRVSLAAWLGRLAGAVERGAALCAAGMTRERVRVVLLAIGIGVGVGAGAAGIWRWAASGSDPEIAELLPRPERTPEPDRAPPIVVPKDDAGASAESPPDEPFPPPAEAEEQKKPEEPKEVVAPAAPELPGLRVRSNVSGDQLFIDGTDVGSTGSSVYPLEPGVHRVRVLKDGYQPFETQVELVAGKPLVTLRAELKRDRAGVRTDLDEARRALAGSDAEAWRAGFAQLLALAELGQAPAQSEVALVLAEGRGKVIPADREASQRWLAKAAEQGDLAAQYLLGLSLEFGSLPEGAREGTPPSPFAEGRGFLRRVFRGEKDFLSLFQGHATPGDAQQQKQAFVWYMKAANRGHAGAGERLGYMFASGRGTDRKPNEAFYWLQRAALGGRAEAQYALGMCYLLGEGYAANPEAAGCWLREAARAGNERARAQVARMDLGEDPGPAKSGVACNYAPFGAP